ncbi:PepSY-associated TM helix domain-containing protein [Polaromonas sp.]|uniref:PepSY-associated TM helix domain-containing protein n=1 Tax=Polaromonas sp. TaxID=1869339 RepID=UPI0037503132
MEPTFRQSMAGLHTWAGVVIGSLLFAIFWMGTLSVFDREIDRWMNPGSRLSPALASQAIQLDGPITDNAMRLTQGSDQWLMRLPSERVPALELRWRDEKTKTTERRYLHPTTGAVLPHTDTLAGTGFIFPFHYSLHLKWKDIGYWLVGLAGMAMLVMVVSGVVIHRKIFADFFLFRPKKQTPRASLDLHNLSGVLSLPFHFVMALSGLIIFMGIYWPSSYSAAYPDAKDLAAARQAFNQDGYGQYKRPRSGASGAPIASLDGMRAQAGAQWQGAEANFIRVWHPGDQASYVELRRTYADSVTMNLDQLYLDARSGQPLHSFTAQPVMTAQRFISGLHFIQFEHWLLRWLYFLAGLSGCIMIATGFIFWLERRRASHAKKGLHGVRVVEALAVASVPGIMVATCQFFIANRLLPLDASWGGYSRAGLEMGIFYVSWLAMLAHAAWRARHAWREQSALLAVLAATAVALNWASTGHHLIHTLGQGLWAVAGMDLMLLASAALAAWTARQLGRTAEEHPLRAASTTRARHA